MEPVEVKAPARTEDPDNQTNDIAKGEVSTGQDTRTVRFMFVSICVVAWWRGEAHQYLNISTHPLRLDMPKEKEQKKWKEKIIMITPWN